MFICWNVITVSFFGKFICWNQVTVSLTGMFNCWNWVTGWLIDWLTSIEHYYNYINGENTTTNKNKKIKRHEILLAVFLYIEIAWVFQLFNIATQISTCISHIAKNYEKNYIIDKVRSCRDTVSVIFHWLGIWWDNVYQLFEQEMWISLVLF